MEVFVLLFLLGFAEYAHRIQKRPWERGRWFEPPVQVILKLPFEKQHLLNNWSLKQKLQMLYPGEKEDKLLWEFRIKQGNAAYSVCVAGCLLTGLVHMKHLLFLESWEKTGVSLYLFTGIVTVLIPWVVQSRLEEKLKEREKSLQLDYPEIIHKFVLLMGAGLTIKGALERMLEEQKGRKLSYSYKELLIILREINNGITEAEAFERMGNRIHMIPYMRFGSFVCQNLKKGTSELIPLLELEAADAFSQRKEQAKRMGEEASTKMLFPMMLMLGIVMAIIIIPAFMTL